MSTTARAFYLALFLLLPTAVLQTGCEPQGEELLDPDRAPLGKVDGVGSCLGNCGGKSEGSCWCDEECTKYGDCCDDKAQICDAPQGKLCGGWLGNTCAADEFCDFQVSAMCGYADASGVCMPRPTVCNTAVVPVCGCNGETYKNRCYANALGQGVLNDGACQAQVITCGGFGNLPCPAGLECVDDPNDSCDPNKGGADCGGVCVEPQGPVNSCQDSCGEKSKSGDCWCDEQCEKYGDCCGDIDDQCSEPERVATAGVCVRNAGDTCQTDADCDVGGCGGELCFNPAQSAGITTCDCVQPTLPEGCGCVNGVCSWYNME